MSKTKPARTSKKTDTVYTGVEPVYDGSLMNDMDIQKALNYYNYYYSGADLKDDLYNYITDAKLSAKIKKVPVAYITNTLCVMCRIINKGGNVGSNNIKWVDEKIKDLAQYSTSNVNALAGNERKSPLESMKETASDICAEIDYKLDDWKNNLDLSVYEMFSQAGVAKQVASFVKDYYTPIKAEIDELVSKKTDDLVEAYSHMKIVDRKKYQAFITKIVDDCDSYLDSKKAARKPRKARAKKVLPATKVVSKVNYLEKDDTLQVMSLAPEKIVGADTVILYDVVQSTIKVIRTNSPSGLTVKGTTILGMSDDMSKSKRLTKGAKETIAEISKMPKLKALKKFASIKNAEKPANGRINGNTLIISVLK